LSSNPYVPVNAPAIDDLFDAFRFQAPQAGNSGKPSDAPSGAMGMLPF